MRECHGLHELPFLMIARESLMPPYFLFHITAACTRGYCIQAQCVITTELLRIYTDSVRH